MTREHPWCRSCGLDVDPDASVCPACRTPTDAPVPGPDVVGTVVTVSGTFRSRPAVVIRQTPDGVELLSKGSAPGQVDRAQVEQLARVAVDGPAVTSASGRLWRVLAAQRQGSVAGRWAVEAVEAAAYAAATTGLGSRRAAAVDAVALGEPARLVSLSLSAGEIAWYRARGACLAGDVPTMLTELESLTPHGYPGRVGLLLASAPRLSADQALADRALADRALALLEPLLGQPEPLRGQLLEMYPDAEALACALAGVPGRAVLTQLRPVADRVDAAAGTSTQRPVAVAVERADRLPAPDPQAAEPPALTVRALDLYLAARDAAAPGTRVDASDPALALLPQPLLHELIESGALVSVPRDAAGWDAAKLAYVQARLDPAGATFAQLRLAGATPEIARRRFLEPDAREAAEALSYLPADDPAVAHYLALVQLRASEVPSAVEGLRPQAAARALQLADLCRRLAAGEQVDLPDNVAKDPTCWRFLRPSAQAGTLLLSADQRSRFPEFAAWVDLCTVQRLVFEGSWEDVRSRGRYLADHSGLEPLTDEALNMVAFAELQLGRPADALRILDTALAGQFTTGLVVNASIVAAESGCLHALPYVARAFRLSTDPRVQRGAIRRAISLWLADDGVPDYPSVLGDIVREALVQPQDDEGLHRTLLLTAARFDSDWLADAVGLDERQPDAVRYFRTRARSVSAHHGELLPDVAAVLVDLKRRSSPPPWVEFEVEWLTKLLTDGVHVAFGEAMHLVPTIDVLLTSGILGLADGLVLSAQAGAHAAVSLEEAGDCISPDAEHRFLFTAISQFWARRGELEKDVAEHVADELGRCIMVAAVSMEIVTGNKFGSLGALWDQLVERRRWDQANQVAIRTQQRQVLDELDGHVTRVRSYLAAAENLPLTDQARDWKVGITESVRKHSAEIIRLRRFQ